MFDLHSVTVGLWRRVCRDSHLSHTLQPVPKHLLQQRRRALASAFPKQSDLWQPLKAPHYMVLRGSCAIPLLKMSLPVTKMQWMFSRSQFRYWFPFIFSMLSQRIRGPQNCPACIGNAEISAAGIHIRLVVETHRKFKADIFQGLRLRCVKERWIYLPPQQLTNRVNWVFWRQQISNLNFK